MDNLFKNIDTGGPRVWPARYDGGYWIHVRREAKIEKHPMIEPNTEDEALALVREVLRPEEAEHAVLRVRTK